MCGMVGAVWTDEGTPLSEAALGAMTDRIRHRGPDDAGTYRDPHAALGFRRLNQTVEHSDTRSIRGMINKVRHLVVVEERPE